MKFEEKCLHRSIHIAFTSDLYMFPEIRPDDRSLIRMTTKTLSVLDNVTRNMCSKFDENPVTRFHNMAFTNNFYSQK